MAIDQFHKALFTKPEDSFASELINKATQDYMTLKAT